MPLPFSVVPTNVSFGSALVTDCVRALAARYPFLRSRSFGPQRDGPPALGAGAGGGVPRAVVYAAAHHANEWITAPLLLRFAEELCEAAAPLAAGVRGIRAGGDTLERAIVPGARRGPGPDGMDLVTGALTEGERYAAAKRVAEAFPDIPFPAG